ncbi:hypothetical protein NDU88_000811 [Pleurodeles waltl]|uniref:Uncharacterized protein n=1 Tax=Pleurodeles waltl TaxID=8319 RepID=A0AAV7VYC8_PLEWA|nr:hypothetical protein NDU88_000811 [Pleurodeles waltl]
MLGCCVRNPAARTRGATAGREWLAAGRGIGVGVGSGGLRWRAVSYGGGTLPLPLLLCSAPELESEPASSHCRSLLVRTWNQYFNVQNWPQILLDGLHKKGST